MANPEIKEFFTEEEKIELREQKPEEYDALLKKSQEYVKKLENDDKLDDLATTSAQTIEDKIKLLERVEISPDNDSVLDGIQGKAKEEFNKWEKEQLNEFKKKGFFGEILKGAYDWVKGESTPAPGDGTLDKYWKKFLGFIGVAILGMFGFKGMKEKMEGLLKGEDGDGENAPEEEVTTPAPEESIPGNEATGPMETDESIEGIDKKKNTYYNIGSNYIFSMTLTEFPNNVYKEPILENFKTVSYKDLNAMKSPDKAQPDETLVFTKARDAFISNDARMLYGASLKKERVLSIMKDNEKDMQGYFSQEEIKSITDIADSGQENFWENYTVEQLNILYAYTLPIVNVLSSGLGGDALGAELSQLSTGVEGQGLDLAGIEKKNLKVIDAFRTGLGGGAILGGRNKLYEDDDVRESVASRLQEKEDKEEIDKIIEFKNYIIGNGDLGFVNSSKLGLSEQSWIDSFYENLNYSWVLTLYTAMGGERLENNPTSLPAVVLIVGNIIGAGEVGNAREKIAYLGTYFKDSVKNRLEFQLSDEETEVLKIYARKMTDVIKIHQMDKAYTILGAIDAFGLDTKDGAMIFGAGLATNLIANRVMSRSLMKYVFPSIISRTVGKLAWIPMALGVGVFANGIIRGNEVRIGSYFDDLDKAEGVEEINRVTEKFEKSIYKFKAKDGKEFIVCSYENDRPYVIYNNKMREIGVLAANKSVGTDKTAFENLDAVGNALFGFGQNSVLEIGNENIDFSKVRIDGDEIIFGIGGQEASYKLEELFIGIDGEPKDLNEIDNKGLVSQFAEGALLVGSSLANKYMYDESDASHEGRDIEIKKFFESLLVIPLEDIGGIGNRITLVELEMTPENVGESVQ